MNYSKDSNKKQKRKINSPSMKAVHFLGTIIQRVAVVFIFLLLFAAVGGGLGIYLGILDSAPVIPTVMDVAPESYTTIVYEAATNKEIDRLYSGENREYADFDQIPQHLKDAVVSVEDERFYTHNGVDFKGMLRALYVNIQNKNFSEGASTITQQLLKLNIFKDNSKKFIRKLQEQYLAVKFEAMVEEATGSKQKAKEYILELYLNTIGLAHGLNGVQAASLYYFGKDVSELTIAESAVIASITNRPESYEPVKKQEANRERQLKTLNHMLEQNMITKLQYDNAVAEDVYAKISATKEVRIEEGTDHSYFVEQLMTEVTRDLQIRYGLSSQQANNMLNKGGLQIYATIDSEMQAIVDEAYKNDELFPPAAYEWQVDYKLSILKEGAEEQTHFNKLIFVKNEEDIEAEVIKLREGYMGENDKLVAERYEKVVQPQSACVILDYHDGQVKAFAANRGEKPTMSRSFNRATQAKRQPGSTFKVLAAYAPGFDTNKISATTILKDEPYKVGNYEPKNSGNVYRGYQTIRDAIAASLNSVAVRTIVEYTGINTAFDYIQNFGFAYIVPDDKVAPLALGGITDGVTPLELTAAYGTIANLGEYNKPIFYTKVLDRNGEVLLDNLTEPKRVLKNTTAFILTDIMKDVVTGSLGTGKQARFTEVKMPISGKTGTSNDYKDLWFAGYTPYYVASVWLGHDQPKTIENNGVRYDVRIWRAIMEKVHQNLPYKDFVMPDGVIKRTVCKVTGNLPGTLCSSTITDYFAQGTQPLSICEGHELIEICTASNKLKTDYCPAETVTPITKTNGEIEAEQNNAERPINLYEYCDVHTLPTLPEPTDPIIPIPPFVPDDNNIIELPEPNIPEPTVPETTTPEEQTPPNDTDNNIIDNGNVNEDLLNIDPEVNILDSFEPNN